MPPILMHSNALQLLLIDSVAGAIAAYLIEEYKLGYLQLSSFTSVDAPFLTVVSKPFLFLSQREYSHLIMDLWGNSGGQIMLGNHLLNFLYSFAFPSHAGLKYS